MDTLTGIRPEQFTDRGMADCDRPQCIQCGSKQVQLGNTTRDHGQPKEFASRNVVQGQWLHCQRCDHRWFAPDKTAADMIQEAENYLLTLEDDASQNLEIRKIARILRLLSERVKTKDALVAQFMQERP